MDRIKKTWSNLTGGGEISGDLFATDYLSAKNGNNTPKQSTPTSTDPSSYFGYKLSGVQKLYTVGGLLILGTFCIFAAFLFLPWLLINPSKFAVTYTFGSVLILSSLGVLRGFKQFATDMYNTERRYFSIAYFTSLLLTLYFSVMVQSYFMVLLLLIFQVVALLWFVISFFPGGSSSFSLLLSTAKTILPI